jgi:hypothetical protein
MTLFKYLIQEYFDNKDKEYRKTLYEKCSNKCIEKFAFKKDNIDFKLCVDECVYLVTNNKSK